MSDWWKKDPKAVEAVEYLLEIGFNADDLLQADAEESGDCDEEE